MEKSACVNLLFLIWTILGCFIVESSAERSSQWSSNNDDRPAKQSLHCYKCNSAYDPNCGDPFEPYTIAAVDCSLVPTPEHLGLNITATICRKSVQKVYGKTRVVRDCGYIKDDRELVKTCSKRSGTHDVHVLYCACESSLCNGGKIAREYSHVLLMIVAMATTVKYFA